MDKKLKILKCFNFPEYDTFEDIFKRSGIKNIDKFTKCFYQLGVDHYIQCDGTKFTLYTVSSVERYKEEVRGKKIQFWLTLIGAVAAVASAIFGLIQLITTV